MYLGQEIIREYKRERDKERQRDKKERDRSIDKERKKEAFSTQIFPISRLWMDAILYPQLQKECFFFYYEIIYLE